ncbi:MAG: hypothetical protein IKR62_03370 [Victivallales bacterium]|nr:hypothetical protein [Victivallales bacterium]
MVDWPTAGRRRCIGTALDGGTPSLHRHGARRRDAVVTFRHGARRRDAVVTFRHGARRRDAVATSAQHSTAGRRRYTGRRRH